jgi:hypothetical protein
MCPGCYQSKLAGKSQPSSSIADICTYSALGYLVHEILGQDSGAESSNSSDERETHLDRQQMRRLRE